MTRLGLLVLVSAVWCCGCKTIPPDNRQDSTTPWIPPDGKLAERDPDTLDHLLNVQRYAQSHGGRLPPPDVNVDH